MSSSPPFISTLGAPRIGPRRELKTALESYWSGKSDGAALEEAAAGLRAASWARQQALGVSHIPSNDFSLYDHVLDTTVLVGAIPDAYGWAGGPVPLDTYFAMARGGAGGHRNAGGSRAVAALEMTKWFDTNYHFMVPELAPNQRFMLATTKPLAEYREAKALGYQTRPVLLGPVTYLALAKSTDAGFKPLSLLERLLPVYAEALESLSAAGAEWVQMDEPCLVLDLDDAARQALRTAYSHLARAVPGLKIMLTTYFGGLGDNLDTAIGLPVAGLHLDLVRAPEQLADTAAVLPPDLVLSLGVVDGRNVWRSDLPRILDAIEPVTDRRGIERIMLAPSCPLLHVPVDLALETDLDPDLRRWLAFAVQKMEELATLGRALGEGRESVAEILAQSAEAAAARRTSPKVHDSAVATRTAAVTADMTARGAGAAARADIQRQRFGLPLFPTTTIGSFPQTAEVRRARSARDRRELADADYQVFLKAETARAVHWQEEIGLDVLVHGEFERNDMVQYFGERLAGFAFTRHGWVQSYGSRCVRPPILFGDVSRPRPMTVDWWAYAQSLTERPMKGMLTGPVTILNWSFVRDDIPRHAACRQIALAIRDEVADLEAAGAAMIQIDEAALREGLPLRRAEWPAYLEWAVACFRLAASGVRDETQIHTHMCYSEFNDIIDAIAAMDADVISIESARSRMELLDALRNRTDLGGIGPGVYDIHSPRVPTAADMTDLLERAGARLGDRQLWVNPDCGLKTRRWEEVRPALVNMVAAARALRAER